MNKIYVDENNQAMFICPKCGFEKIINAMNFRNTTSIVKGECKCKEAFQIVLEFRKYHRKKVSLSGEYIVQKSREKGEVIIREISLTGIRFESLKPHKISKYDILEMKFILDNPLRSEIRKVAKVIWIKDRIIGANFSETELYKHALGFYMKT